MIFKQIIAQRSGSILLLLYCIFHGMSPGWCRQEILQDCLMAQKQQDCCILPARTAIKLVLEGVKSTWKKHFQDSIMFIIVSKREKPFGRTSRGGGWETDKCVAGGDGDHGKQKPPV